MSFAEKYKSFRSTPPIRLTKDPKQILGLMGAGLLFLGVFTPIIHYPFAGSMNFFQHTYWAGPVVLILAVISVFLSLTGRTKRLWFPGFLSLGIAAAAFINIQFHLTALREKITMRPAMNPMSGWVENALPSIDIQGGWAFLVAGSLLLAASTAWKEKKDQGLPGRASSDLWLL